MSTQEKTAQPASEANPPLQRRKRASVGGHHLKLDAEQRPGYQRRFVNGSPERIAEMRELGYVPVSGTAPEGTRRTEGMGSVISRHAGLDAQGKPYQAVLMETPDSLYAQGVAEKEEGRQAFEETIRRGLKTEDTPDGAYIPSPSQISRSG